MTQPMRHVNPGEPFKPMAAEWNRFIDNARWGDSQRSISRPGPVYATGVNPVYGVLTSAITAASPDGTTGATTFTFKRWRRDSSDTHDPQYLLVDATDTVGINRSQMTGSAGKFVICLEVEGDLVPIWVDC